MFTELMVLTGGTILLLVATLVFILVAAKAVFIWITIQENYAVIVLKGDQYLKTLLAKKGSKVEENGDIVDKRNDDPKDSLLQRWLGVHYIGIPFITKIHTWEQSWVAWKMIDGKDYQAVPETQILRQVYLAEYPYFVKAMGVETKDLIPFDFAFVITARVINPYKAAFVAHDWVRQMTAMVQQAVIKYAGEKTFEEITADKALGANACVQLIENEIVTIMRESYGVKIVKTSIQGIDPDSKYRELTLKRTEAIRQGEALKATAEAKAEATKTEATGEANAITIKALAEAQALETKAKALREQQEEGKLLVAAGIAEQMAKNSRTVVIGSEPLEVVNNLLKGVNKK